ncbi:MAG: GNAT family N-acetyltransferase [Anaerolineae bacterium]|nr:GNAT family N-acetyltransferase [Anaerolineae bacterium]
MSLVHTLEDISNHALPARLTLDYDGWLLRVADSPMRRANSAQAYAPSTLPLGGKIDYCEMFYRAHGRRIVFKMISTWEPSALAAALIARGYVEDCLTSIQICALAVGAAPVLPDGLTLEMLPRADDTWQAEIRQLHTPAERPLMETPGMYAAITAQMGCFRLARAGETVGMGLGVLERGWLGLYSLIIAAEQRGRGYGTALVQALLQWGASQGAHGAYLQVMCDNASALRLYSRIGFREVYRYWYLQSHE